MSEAKVINKDALAEGDTSQMDTTKKITCLNTAQYDDDIKNYTCTPTCNIPSYNKVNMLYEWNHNEPPQIGQPVK